MSTEPKFNYKIDTKYLNRLLTEMVEINSILGNEKELAIYLAEECQELGLAIQLEDAEPNRPNIYASHIFSNDGKALNFNGHIDTVDISSGWESDPFIPTTKDNRLYGLGAVDMKAGIACELAAIKALIDSNEALTGQLQFSGVIDEEGYGMGAKKMLQNPFFNKMDAVVIPEPFHGDSKDNSLPLGMTGKILYKITFKGKSAHAFNPDEGINAVTDASKFITSIMKVSRGENDNKFSLPFDSDLGYGSFCVLKIEGGYKIYSVTVPESCEIILNRLLVGSETKESATTDLTNFIKTLQLDSTVNLEVVPPYYNSYKIDKHQPIVRALEKSYLKVFKSKPYFGYRKTITDANIFCGEGNIPTVILGPKGGNLHAANEYVELDSLERTALAYCYIYDSFQRE